MKILHVNKFLRDVGGAESYMFALADLQRREGNEVAFFGMSHPDNRREVDEALGAGIALAPSIALDDVTLGRGAKFEAATAMLWNERARKAMAALLDDFQPDVVHLHNIYHQLSPSILDPVRRRGVATVMTLHDYKLVCPTYRFLDDGQLCQDCVTKGFRSAVRRRCQNDSLGQSTLLALESRLHRTLGAYGAVDTFLCPSRFLKDVVDRAGVFPDRLVHLPNFVADRVSADQYSPPASADTDPLVLFVGRLSHEKGVDVLVDAARVLQTSAEVVIVGDGPELNALKDRVARTGSPAKLVGRMPNDRVRELLESAALMVVPSRWHENQPISVLEALSQQIPVVSTDLGGLPELVIDGVTGSIVRSDDPAALAAAIDLLVVDDARRRAMGVAGAEMVAAEHSPSVHTMRLNAHYEEALARH